MSGQPVALRIRETLPACVSSEHPEGCRPDLGRVRLTNGWVVERNAVVYEWDSGLHYRNLHEDEWAAGTEFLRTHGIDPLAFVIGNEIVVRVRCDGSLWLHTRRSVGNVPLSEAPMCSTCSWCVAQEQVVVPLVTAVPMLTGAYLADHVTVPTVEVAAVGG